MIRYALLARGKEPVLWDFGSAVKHHQLHSSWVPEENYRAGFLGFRGAVAPSVGLMETRSRRSSRYWSKQVLPTCRSAWTSSSRRSCSRCSGKALPSSTLNSSCSTPAASSPQDEIILLNQAAAMVDGVYQDIVEALKPGVRENEIVALRQQATL